MALRLLCLSQEDARVIAPPGFCFVSVFEIELVECCQWQPRATLRLLQLPVYLLLYSSWPVLESLFQLARRHNFAHAADADADADSDAAVENVDHRAPLIQKPPATEVRAPKGELV